MATVEIIDEIDGIISDVMLDIGAARYMLEQMIQEGRVSPNDLMGIAASGGHHAILALNVARDSGASEFDWMLEVAADARQKPICYLAALWGATNTEEVIARLEGESGTKGLMRTIARGYLAANPW